MKIVVQNASGTFLAFLESVPYKTQSGRSEAEAIGNLIIAYATCWPELWPGLEVERR